MVNKKPGGDRILYKIYRNILYWSLIKYKQVIRSMLASKIYSMVRGFNLGIIIFFII
jgi:hypothetical protein